MAADHDDASRFAHLLKPIRDLATNWDIDVASALEDYMDDLEHLTIELGDEIREAVGDGAHGEANGALGTSVNFAEAALLIQVRGWYQGMLVLCGASGVGYRCSCAMCVRECDVR